uniref:BRCT domain-containing protein n=1 Tax=Ditylenchus dipsaci TaxID=166011 RepID=A0A915D443_9BILA
MRIKKKYEVGTARVFISQKQALNKLQLSLKDFRRLCILKGIYPREPLHAKKANKGSTESKIYYHLKDVNFLSSEPLIKKFREYKIFLRRLTTAKAKREDKKAQSLIENKPVFRLDNLVKERYPTFASALQDLDDALCLLFAFSALTQSKIARPNVIAECRRLTTEFMHFVIESHSLNKVFVSIKGIYYQAEMMARKLLGSWVMKEQLSLGLFYPPQLQKSLVDAVDNDVHEDGGSEDKVYSLALPIDRAEQLEPDVAIDTFDEVDTGENLTEKIQQAQTLRKMFCKFKVVPKEPLTFIIRSCGGTVSWEGSPSQCYNEPSNLVTHQIVDRSVDNFNINRIYIQPQWVFDCFNARRLLPTVKYAPCVSLPPHLSPFAEESVGEYVPQEKLGHLMAGSSKGEPQKKKSKKDALPQKKEVGMKVQVGKAFKENKQKEINQKGHDLKLREMMIQRSIAAFTKRSSSG